MSDYWLLVIAGIICIIIAYGLGYESGHDSAIRDILKHFDEEKAREANEKEGKQDDCKR